MLNIYFYASEGRHIVFEPSVSLSVGLSEFFMSGPYLYYPWMDFQITWQKCLAYQDVVALLSQRSRSHRQFKCKNATICVWSVILLCMEGF